jgi:hypothetical protein
VLNIFFIQIIFSASIITAYFILKIVRQVKHDGLRYGEQGCHSFLLVTPLPKHCKQERIVCNVTSDTVTLNSVIDLPIIGQVFKSVVHSFIHSIGMCRMRRSLAVLRSFFHSVIYFFLSLFSTNYFSILPHFILPSISWSTSWSC